MAVEPQQKTSSQWHYSCKGESQCPPEGAWQRHDEEASLPAANATWRTRLQSCNDCSVGDFVYLLSPDEGFLRGVVSSGVVAKVIRIDLSDDTVDCQIQDGQSRWFSIQHVCKSNTSFTAIAGEEVEEGKEGKDDECEEEKEEGKPPPAEEDVQHGDDLQLNVEPGLEYIAVPKGGDKYSGICLASDGLLYCSPMDRDDVLVIDPKTKSCSFIEGAGGGVNKYSGICSGPNGSLYCAPRNSTRVLVILPRPDGPATLSFIEGAGEGSDKWSGICKGLDGLLYCAPRDSSRVLVIDPLKQSLSFIDGAGTGGDKFSGICCGTDGRLYCAPLKSNQMLVIDAENKSCIFVQSPSSESSSYSGICQGPDGCMYCAPLDSGNILQFMNSSGPPSAARRLQASASNHAAASLPPRSNAAAL